MTTFLFWNLNRKPLTKRVARIAANRDVDVVILAECLIESDQFLAELRGATSYRYARPFSQCEKITIYTRFPASFLRQKSESARYTIRRLRLPGIEEVLLAAAHLPSKLHTSSESQVFECEDLAEEIRSVEKLVGHARTVLVGDLNVNPFESGMIGAKGLHGVMARSIAEQGRRIVQGKSFPFFYNPMWSRMGDESTGPSGTYHDNRAEQVNLF